MRELNECRAEVFRRSENRIKERKRNRNRILAMCIPLCLIVMVWSVTILPGMLPAGKDAAGENLAQTPGNLEDADGAVGSAGESKTHGFVSVTVKDGEYTCELTDASVVNKVFQQIFDIQEANGEYKDSADMQEPEVDGDAEHKDAASNATTNAGSITITMTSADGSKRVYTLNGLTLYDETLEKGYELTEAQRNDLLVALELADY